MHRLAITAHGCSVLGSAMRANGARQEGIKGLAALFALPLFANWRSSTASGASKALSPAELSKAQQRTYYAQDSNRREEPEKGRKPPRPSAIM
jgi:hypothetical protein